VDDDTVDLSNLQRQILHATEDVGTPKVDSAQATLNALDPEVEVITYSTRLHPENALEIMEGWDLVLDGTDNLPTRYLVDDACSLLGTPWVYGSVFRFEGQVSLFNHEGGPCYRDLFPEPPPPEAVPSCSDAGVFGVLPGVVGVLQATEAIKHLLGLPTVGLRLFLMFAPMVNTSKSVSLIFHFTYPIPKCSRFWTNCPKTRTSCFIAKAVCALI
jgi:adenylyltransferase/sulfurtransferase